MQVWGACPVRTWRGKANTVLECRRPTFRSALFCVVRGCLAVLDPRPAQGDCQPPWLLGPSLLGSPAGRCTCRGEGTLGQTSLEADKPSAPGVAPPTAASPARSLSVGPGGCVFKCHAPPTDHGIWSHFFNKELSTPGLACGDPEVGRGNSRLLGADCAPGSLAVSRQLLTYEQYRCWAGRGPRAGCTWSFGGQGRGGASGGWARKRGRESGEVGCHTSRPSARVGLFQSCGFCFRGGSLGPAGGLSAALGVASALGPNLQPEVRVRRAL